MHAPVLDMQVASADAAHRHTHDGIGGFNQYRLRLLHQSEFSIFYVCVGKHNL